MYDYVKQITWSRVKAGFVITSALLIIFLAVMFAGNIERLFLPRTTIYAVLHDVKGLRKGSPVWFSGVEIGSVQSIRFTPQQKIKVSLAIDDETLKYLKKDSVANILTLGLLGDRYVEITPGSKQAGALKAGDTIAGSTPTEFQDIVESSQESISRLSDFIGMLEEILVKIEKGKGTMSKLLKDPAVYNNLRETTGELAKLVKKIESGKGTMSRLVNDEALFNDISSSVTDIKLFAETLRASEGTLKKAITDPALYDRFLKASESLDKFTKKLETSRGTVNRLIEDESLYENINSASENLDRLLESVNKGEGLMGSLVKDEELTTELKTTLKELNTLIKDIKEHPGKYFKFSIF